MVLALLQRSTYMGMLALLAAAGLGVPIPEDLTLMTGGYLARQGITSLVPTLLVGYAGVLLGDLLIFRLGRKLKDGIYTHPRLRRLFTPRRREWIERHFEQRGLLTVAIARHLGGLRAPTFLVAGTSGMETWKFLIADGFSAMLTVPAVTYLGFFCAQNLNKARQQVHRVHLWVLVALVLVALGLFFYHRFQRRQFASRQAAGEGSAAH